MIIVSWILIAGNVVMLGINIRLITKSKATKATYAVIPVTLAAIVTLMGAL